MLLAAELDPSSLQKENEELRKKVDYLEEQIAWFQRQVFGQRSERFVPPVNKEVVYLPGMEPDPEAEKDTPEEEEVAAHKRKKRKAKNDNSNGITIPENLPVEQTILDLTEEEKKSPETGEELVRIGEEVTRQLAYRSGHYFVKETIRPKYILPSREEEGVKICPHIESILPKSRADESLLAEIVTKKYADHLPLYRIAEIFSRDGVQLTRQLLSQWIIRLGIVLFPLYELMQKQIKESGNAYIDETPVKLQVKGKGRLQQGYMWVLVGGLGSDPPYRVYQFFPDRQHKNAHKVLEGFSGVFHSDKYGAYVEISKKENVIWQPCWVHVRRKFEDAQSGDAAFRKMFLRKVRYLFMFERVAWSRSEEERLRIRREKEAPIIDDLIAAVKEKVEQGKLLPKSKFREALYYFHGLIPHLKTYLNHANARMDNNVAERAIRPLALGRKNWLFIGSMKGGQAASVLLSLVQTCRGLGINPRDYLEDIMRRFHSHPNSRLSELLPDQWAAAKQKEPTKTKPLHVR